VSISQLILQLEQELASLTEQETSLLKEIESLKQTQFSIPPDLEDALSILLGRLATPSNGQGAVAHVTPVEVAEPMKPNVAPMPSSPEKKEDRETKLVVSAGAAGEQKTAKASAARETASARIGWRAWPGNLPKTSCNMIVRR
jgi:hypothetical protein